MKRDALDRTIAELEKQRAKLLRIQALRGEIARLEAGAGLGAVPTSGPRLSYRRMVAIAADECCKEFQVEAARMFSRHREEPVARARMVAYFVARSEGRIPLQQIGDWFQRDHGTVSCGCRSVQDSMDTDFGFRAVVERVTAVCRLRWETEKEEAA